MLNQKLNYLNNNQKLIGLEEICEELEQIMSSNIDTKYVETQTWRVEYEIRTSDTWLLEELYNKLLLKGQKSISKYISLKYAIKKSNIIEIYRQKKSLIQEITNNKDIIHDFSDHFSIKNAYNFANMLEIMQDYQKIYDKIYYSFYKKINLKPLDFHYIWKLFCDLEKAKKMIIDGIYNKEIQENDRIILTENLDNINISINEFIDSKIKIEDTDKVLDKKLKDKRKKNNRKKWILKKNQEINKK